MGAKTPWSLMRGAAMAGLLLGAILAGCLGGPNSLNGPSPGDDDEAPSGGFSSTHVFPGDYVDDTSFSMTLTEGPLEALPAEVAHLTGNEDGAAIAIGIVRPNVDEGVRVPVIVQASPYFPTLAEGAVGGISQRLTQNFVGHGYAVAFLAVRGTGGSGGCSDLFGALETSDLDQAITWLGTQEWSNGNVGMLGVSYDGSTPWIVAGQGNPHLKTIVPISGLSDVFHLEYRNGTVEQRMLGLVQASYYYGAVLDDAFGLNIDLLAQSAACPALADLAAAAVESGATGERDSLGVYEERNHRPRVLENYEGSVMLVHGLQDWNVDPHHAYPFVNELEEHGIVVKHLLGQWGHAWPDSYMKSDPDRARTDWAEILLHWFAYWLKEDTSVDIGPRAQVQDTQLRWRSEDTWPPDDRVPTSFYLGGGGTSHVSPSGTLTRDPSDAAAANVPLGPHPFVLSGDPKMDVCTGCPGTAMWESEPLDDELHIAGMPRVHVTVTPTAPGGTVSAFLYSNDDGVRSRVGWTMMDLRFAAGGETSQQVTPGVPLVAKMQLEPLDASIPAGASLELVITTGPQHDRVNAAMGAPAILQAGGESSVLVVDTIERSEDAFFAAP